MMINMQQQPAFIFTKAEKDLLLTLITVEQSKKCDNEKLLNFITDLITSEEEIEKYKKEKLEEEERIKKEKNKKENTLGFKILKFVLIIYLLLGVFIFLKNFNS